MKRQVIHVSKRREKEEDDRSSNIALNLIVNKKQLLQNLSL
jgi:hypothetical protein